MPAAHAALPPVTIAPIKIRNNWRRASLLRMIPPDPGGWAIHRSSEFPVPVDFAGPRDRRGESGQSIISIGRRCEPRLANSTIARPSRTT